MKDSEEISFENKLIAFAKEHNEKMKAFTDAMQIKQQEATRKNAKQIYESMQAHVGKFEKLYQFNNNQTQRDRLVQYLSDMNVLRAWAQALQAQFFSDANNAKAASSAKTVPAAGVSASSANASKPVSSSASTGNLKIDKGFLQNFIEQVFSFITPLINTIITGINNLVSGIKTFGQGAGPSDSRIKGGPGTSSVQAPNLTRVKGGPGPDPSGVKAGLGSSGIKAGVGPSGVEDSTNPSFHARVTDATQTLSSTSSGRKAEATSPNTLSTGNTLLTQATAQKNSENIETEKMKLAQRWVDIKKSISEPEILSLTSPFVATDASYTQTVHEITSLYKTIDKSFGNKITDTTSLKTLEENINQYEKLLEPVKAMMKSRTSGFDI